MYFSHEAIFNINIYFWLFGTEERCWEIYYDRDMSWSALVNKPEATDEFNCREYCLEFWQCNVFRWHYDEKDVTQRCWIMEYGKKRTYSKGSWKLGMNSWVMDERCQDWTVWGLARWDNDPYATHH